MPGILDEAAGILRGYGFVTRVSVICSGSGAPEKIRGTLRDGSLADVYLSGADRFSYHWDRQNINGTLFRVDNAPPPRVEEGPGVPPALPRRFTAERRGFPPER